MRHSIFVILLACACALTGAALGASSQGAPDATASVEADTTPDPGLTQSEIQAVIDRYRHRTWHWQRVMGLPVTLTLRHPPAAPMDKIRVWKRISYRMQQAALHPPHARAWSCIHRYEGAWTDPNPPYYGGLQMDLGFQRAYGSGLLVRKGTADHWTPLEQMWVAERALRSGRGFYPWPNTGRWCGLI